MSFFDDDDPPTRAQPRARPRAPRQGAPRGGGGASRGGSGARRPSTRSADEQQIMVRRLVAGGIGLLLLILIVLMVKSCANSRKVNALKDYNRRASQIAQDSSRNAEQVFGQLNQGGDANDLQAKINDLRLAGDTQVKQARNLHVPGQMQRAQNDLVLVLNLRASALGQIAADVPNAGSDNGQTAETAVTSIAGQMQALLASDVVYSQRVAPYIRDALSDADVSGQSTAASRSLPSLGWLDVDNVARVLNAKRAAGGEGGNPKPAPGLHGHGLTSVSVGDTTLESGSDAVNRIPASGAGVGFTVKFANQGDNNENDVNVSVAVTGSGKAIRVAKRVNQTQAGTDATVTIPLGQSPPIGQPVTIKVTVGKVPGETNTTNNSQSYTAIFTR